MNLYICFSLLLLSHSAHSNPFAELTGDAARARTAEARARANGLRAAAGAAINEINRKRAEIEATKNQILADKEKLKTWTRDTRAFVEAGIAKLPEQSQQMSQLLNSLTKQADLVAATKRAFSEYAENAVKYSEAAKSTLELNQLARRSNLSATEIFVAYLSAFKELDLAQTRALSALAWQKGREALYSTEPVTQHVETTLGGFIRRANAESVVETLAIINSLDQGLQIQVERATKLNEGANSLGQAFIAIRDGLNKQDEVP